MGFNSGFKGLIMKAVDNMIAPCREMISHESYLDKLQGQLAFEAQIKNVPITSTLHCMPLHQQQMYIYVLTVTIHEAGVR